MASVRMALKRSVKIGVKESNFSVQPTFPVQLLSLKRCGAAASQAARWQVRAGGRSPVAVAALPLAGVAVADKAPPVCDGLARVWESIVRVEPTLMRLVTHFRLAQADRCPDSNALGPVGAAANRPVNGVAGLRQAFARSDDNGQY